ncbi:helix-turn-helix transcriptional regulator [Chromobacterium sp. IIBBL 290-4]|uniref:S24 family peptidase n=1 Tax=Chromobacterium sp. IIBBL 290-4 TaxID=2953890 RepID=UPI0020B8E0B3|nr:helix-turn-helix transcriptional regulator [Chromobacterium sp. IIBBL 290-4]UTH76031.1 helix-turn-helix transcriptional regulator [Chromobacterium sp. IIBBL 290-4]
MEGALQQTEFRQRLELLIGLEKPYAWAARIGINKGSFTNMWYKGGVPRQATARRIADSCDVRFEWLMFGEGAMRDAARAREEPRREEPVAADLERQQDKIPEYFVPADVGQEFCFIPRYNLKASAGFGSNGDDERPMFYMAFRRYWVKNYLNASPSDLVVISVKGDSMSGVLEDRDTILVNTAESSPGEGLFVIRIGDDIFVKQLQRLPGGAVQVKSANPLYESFTVDLGRSAGEFEVIGRVVWFGRQIG